MTRPRRGCRRSGIDAGWPVVSGRARVPDAWQSRSAARPRFRAPQPAQRCWPIRSCADRRAGPRCCRTATPGAHATSPISSFARRCATRPFSRLPGEVGGGTARFVGQARAASEAGKQQQEHGHHGRDAAGHRRCAAHSRPDRDHPRPHASPRHASDRRSTARLPNAGCCPTGIFDTDKPRGGYLQTSGAAWRQVDLAP